MCTPDTRECNGMPGVCRRRPALAFRHLAGSDPKARSALQDRKAGSVPEAYTRVTASRELADLPAAFSHRGVRWSGGQSGNDASYDMVPRGDNVRMLK